MKKLLILLSLICLPCNASNLYENNSYKIVIERANFEKAQAVLPAHYFKYEKWTLEDIRNNRKGFVLSLTDTALLMFGYRHGALDKIQHRTICYVGGKVTKHPVLFSLGFTGMKEGIVDGALGLGKADFKDVIANLEGTAHAEMQK